jgi:hypothetical protein
MVDPGPGGVDALEDLRARSRRRHDLMTFGQDTSVIVKLRQRQGGGAGLNCRHAAALRVQEEDRRRAFQSLAKNRNGGRQTVRGSLQEQYRLVRGKPAGMLA